MPGDRSVRTFQLQCHAETTRFLEQMPHEQLLIVQTDALLAKPLNPFFFNFSYLGAPFLPRQHSEYFTMRDPRATSVASSKPIRQSMDRPTAMSTHTSTATADYRSVQKQQCKQSAKRILGKIQPRPRSRRRLLQPSHQQVSTPAPLEIAQAFATETTYNPNAVGSHACWKFLDGGDLAHHFEQHLREAWAMTTVFRNQVQLNYQPAITSREE